MGWVRYEDRSAQLKPRARLRQGRPWYNRGIVYRRLPLEREGQVVGQLEREHLDYVVVEVKQAEAEAHARHRLAMKAISTQGPVETGPVAEHVYGESTG